MDAALGGSGLYDAARIARILRRPEPTPEQRAVIEAPLHSMLVVAGAGSGKTETMAARVVWLVANGLVAPEQVLGLTFTRKAASELATRILSRLRALADAGSWSRPAGQEPAAWTADAVVPGAAGGGHDEGTAMVSTYHAYAGRIVQEHGVRLGVEPDARLLTEAAAWQLAHAVVTAYDGPMDQVTHAEATVTRAVVALSGEAAEHLCGLDDIGDYYERFEERLRTLPPGASRAKGMPGQVRELLTLVGARRQVLPIVGAYARAKRDRGCLDFADQVALAARLALDFPDVGRAERSRYRVVLLDEFQDTSEAQLVLLRSLFADPAAGAQVPVVAVGDPHQSIYGWRGASATTLARFPRLFGAAPEASGAEADVLHLSVSWRNSEAVLAVANRVAAPLAARSPIPVRRLQPAPGADVGSVESARLGTMVAEADYVAARIAREWFDAAGRPTGASAAVLCRRRAQFVPIVDALRAQDLPVEVVGLGGLVAMPEVQDVVALLSVVADPGRGDRLMRLITGPAYRLGAADLDGLGAWARELRRRDRRRRPVPGADGSSRDGDVRAGEGDAWPGTNGSGRDEGAFRGDSPRSPGLVPVEEQPSIVEALEQLPPPGWIGPEGESLNHTARRRLADLARLIRRLRASTGASLAELCSEAERLLRLDVELLARHDVPPEVARVHLDAFADAAAGFSAAADRPTLGAFLAWLEVALEEERGLEAPVSGVATEAVQVLTVHAAKGLEWDVVAVPGLVEGAFPSTGAVRSTYDEKARAWRLGPDRDRGWCVGLERLPYDLRGDADGLPPLRWRGVPDVADLDKDLTAMYEAGGARVVAEERRLAYVAVTRARRLALLTAPVWTDATTPRITSRFLLDLIDEAAMVVGPWAPMPEPGTEGATSPGDGRATTAAWPHDPLAARREAVARGAAVWAEELAALPADLGDRAAVLEAEIAASALAGCCEDVELLALVRERRETATGGPATVELPGHLSASSLVALSADEAAFAESLRRPMPAPPAMRARAGTAFHAWVEQHYQRAAILDLDDLPGSGDADEDVLDLADAKERFLRSLWAAREPVEVELALETNIGGVSVRGRIDAVFLDPERRPRGVVVVDWKTGRPPTGERAKAASVQLGVYRLAYARLRGLPLDAVRAAFYYVATGETVYPEVPGEDELVSIIDGSASPRSASPRSVSPRSVSPRSVSPRSVSPRSVSPRSG